MAIGGYVFGFLYLQTGSLWSPWLAHTIHNSVLNLLHIRTMAGLDSDVLILHIAFVLGLLATVPLIRALAAWSALVLR